MKNKILLRRQRKFIVTSGDEKVDFQTFATFSQNLESLGFRCSKELFVALSQSKTFCEDAILMFGTLKEMLGADKVYRPMYPNFPKQVMEASDAELYINALYHYTGVLFGLNLLPQYEKEDRPELTEFIKLKEIGLGTWEEFHEMFRQIMTSKTSISEQDKADLIWYLENGEVDLPDKIPFKEVLAVVARVIIESGKTEFLTPYCKSATDILRIAVALSDGDMSLATNTKFKSFNRKTRRTLLFLLESVELKAEDMLRHREKWKRLNEKLHSHEYAKLCPMAVTMLGRMHKKEYKIETFNSQVEQMLAKGQAPLGLLRQRPTEFARRLDKLLRMEKNCDNQQVTTAFHRIASKVSTPVLLNLITHFEFRKAPELRVFFPKGSLSKIYARHNLLEDIPTEDRVRVIGICNSTLVKRFESLERLPSMYIDPELRNIVVPFSERSASTSFKRMTRGSRFQLENKNFVRMFIWWKNIDSKDKGERKVCASCGDYHGRDSRDGRVDIDLSVVIVDEKFQYKDHVAYTNLQIDRFKAYHSGDITDAPNGACEFIDIDLDSITSNGGRYILMSVNSYTNQKFSNIPEVLAGWMNRKDVNSGEIFEAKTVDNKYDLTSEATISVPMVIDAVDKRVIWCDLAMTSSNFHFRNFKVHTDIMPFIEKNVTPFVRQNIRTVGNNVLCNMNKNLMIVKSMVEMKRPNLYELFWLHATARGSEVISDVEKKDLAELVVDKDTYTIEEIMSEFL
jgi:stress response protein SCP2